jgi:hypothetical protein
MLHIESPVDDWPQAVARLPGGALVKAFAVQWLSEAKAANPGVFTLHRYWNDGIQHVSPGDTEATRENRARDWFNRFIDGTFLDGSTAGIPHWQATNAISFWNEYYAGSQSAAEKELWWRQERTAARIWRDEYRRGPHAAKLGHIRLAICAAPVGNDIPWQSAQTAQLYDCILDYHGYNKYIGPGVRDPLSWRYHSGRWAWMDADFRARGYTCDWLLGEAGPYEGVETGWRHSIVLGGDVAAYLEDVRWFIRQIKTTNAYQTGRFKGFALFTTGGGAVWQWFETRQPTLNGLADVVREEFTAPTPPPPPPPTRDPEPALPTGIIDYVTALPTVSSPYPFPVRSLAAIDKIVIHHSAGSPTRTPESINTMHQGHPRYYPRIGYHVYILGDGTAYKVNLLTDRAWHAGPVGNDGVGICLAGDFTNVHPTPAQMETARRVIQWLRGALGELPLTKHLDFSGTQCPGNTWSQWWSQLEEEPETPMEPWMEAVWQAGKDTQRITIRPHFGFETHLRNEFPGYNFVGEESSISAGGENYGYRRAEHLAGTEPPIVLVYKKPWGSGPVMALKEDGLADAGGFSVAPPILDIPLFITSGWRTARIYQGVSYEHEGLDFRAVKDGKPVTIHATTAGTIEYIRATDPGTGYGKYVRLRHNVGGETYRTTYAHLSSISAGLSVGQVVNAGHVLGVAGTTGGSTGIHLHFGLEWAGHRAPGKFIQGDWIDPRPYLGL